MSTQPSLIDRVLIDILNHPNQTAEQRAGRVGSNANGVHTACWTLRRQELLDGDNKPTQAGVARCETFKAANDGVTSPTEAAAPEKPRRKPGKKSKKNTPPQAKTKTVGVPAIPAAPPATRLEAAHRVADSVIANARNAQRVLRAYLDESVEITPVLESLLDSCAGAITVIEHTYQAAR